MTLARVCPTCKRPYTPGANRRVCARCRGPISSGHKWRFGDDGRAEHRDCENPYRYPGEQDDTPVNTESEPVQLTVDTRAS